MNMNKTAMAAALSLGVVFAATVEQADAYVYARSYIDIDDAQLGAFNADGTAATVIVKSYVNSITNGSSLNSVIGAATGAVCTLNGAIDSCPVSTIPVLDSDPSQMGSTYANNDFNHYGPLSPGAEFARADNVVNTAAIVEIRDGTLPFFARTDVEAIAEAQLQGGANASSGSIIQSTTGLTLGFAVAGASGFFLDFAAIWDQHAAIDTLGQANGASAQFEIDIGVTLARDGTQDILQWTPGGPFGDCLTTFGVCTSTKPAGADLNILNAVSTDPGVASNSGAGRFRMEVLGLSDGDWTLTLNSTVKTLLTQNIPVPGTLAIMGLGLAGMGLFGRRRRGVPHAG